MVGGGPFQCELHGSCFFLEVAMQYAFQVKCFYTMGVRGLLDGGLVMAHSNASCMADASSANDEVNAAPRI